MPSPCLGGVRVYVRLDTGEWSVVRASDVGEEILMSDTETRRPLGAHDAHTHGTDQRAGWRKRPAQLDGTLQTTVELRNLLRKVDELGICTKRVSPHCRPLMFLRTHGVPECCSQCLKSSKATRERLRRRLLQLGTSSAEEESDSAPLSTILGEAQMLHERDKRGSGRVYSHAYIAWSFGLFSLLGRGKYESMRINAFLPLPDARSLNRRIPRVPLAATPSVRIPGNGDEEFQSHVDRTVHTAREYFRSELGTRAALHGEDLCGDLYVSVAFDEASLAEGLLWVGGNVIGVVDELFLKEEDVTVETLHTKLATKVYVFVARSMYAVDLRVPVALIPCRALNTGQVQQMVQMVWDSMKKHDFDVRLFISDSATEHVKAMKKMKVRWLPDPGHLLKRMRNLWSKLKHVSGAALRTLVGDHCDEELGKLVLGAFTQAISPVRTASMERVPGALLHPEHEFFWKAVIPLAKLLMSGLVLYRRPLLLKVWRANDLQQRWLEAARSWETSVHVEPQPEALLLRAMRVWVRHFDGKLWGGGRVRQLSNLAEIHEQKKKQERKKQRRAQKGGDDGQGASGSSKRDREKGQSADGASTSRQETSSPAKRSRSNPAPISQTRRSSTRLQLRKKKMKQG